MGGERSFCMILGEKQIEIIDLHFMALLFLHSMELSFHESMYFREKKRENGGKAINKRSNRKELVVSRTLRHGKVSSRHTAYTVGMVIGAFQVFFRPRAGRHQQ